MKSILLLTLTFAAFAQSGNEKFGDLLQDRALYDAVARLKTDDRIAMYAALSGTKPEDAHYQNQWPRPICKRCAKSWIRTT